MEILNKYIKGLLFIYDCVIIPDFGAFVSNYAEAQYLELTHSFYPPKKNIRFNKNLTYNDGLLINTIAKNLKISYLEAEGKVKTEVQNMRLALEANEKVNLTGIGVFEYKNEKIIFHQETTQNFLAESFGLSIFRFPPLNYQKKIQNLSVTHKSTTMNSGLKKPLKWAAILLPIIGILALIPYVKNNKQQTAGIDFGASSTYESIEEMHTAASADTDVVKIMNRATDKKTALFYTETKQVQDVKKQSNQNQKFHIIGASYKNKNNALKHAKMFEKEGFKQVEVIETNELFRVAVNTFDDKLNALHELRRVRHQTKNDKFWLLAE